MPPIKTRKKLYKQQSRTSEGRFGPKKMNNKQLPTQNELNNNEEADDDIFELEIPELEDAGEWGDNDDSGWEDEIDLEKEKETQLKFMKAELGKKTIILIICFFIYSFIIVFRVECK
jgi:hypothetical protein